jgi:hypothetical protein
MKGWEMGKTKREKERKKLLFFSCAQEGALGDPITHKLAWGEGV